MTKRASVSKTFPPKRHATYKILQKNFSVNQNFESFDSGCFRKSPIKLTKKRNNIPSVTHKLGDIIRNQILNYKDT